MYELLGVLLIIVALVLTGWWIYKDHHSKVSAISLCIVAVFIGVFFILKDRITEITIKDVGTIKSAVKQATIDAEVIAEIRKRIQAQRN
jgi:uncharacterized membrane protein YccF (DUF307 family)